MNNRASPASGTSLDPREVTETIIKTAKTLPALVSPYLLNPTVESWAKISDNIKKTSNTSPSMRWGTIEAYAALAAATVAGTHMDSHLFRKNTETISGEDNGNPDQEQGRKDAYMILATHANPHSTLSVEWLDYADSRACPTEQYVAMLETLLMTTCMLIFLVAQQTKTSPLEVWKSILPGSSVPS